MWYTPLQAAELNSFPDWPYTPAAVQLLIDNKITALISQVPIYLFDQSAIPTSTVVSKPFLQEQSSSRVLSAESAARLTNTTTGSRVKSFQVDRTYSFSRGA